MEDKETSDEKKCRPWRHYADGCPWKQWRTDVLCCNGNIDGSGVYVPCCEEECALYHFVNNA